MIKSYDSSQKDLQIWILALILFQMHDFGHVT